MVDIPDGLITRDVPRTVGNNLWHYTVFGDENEQIDSVDEDSEGLFLGSEYLNTESTYESEPVSTYEESVFNLGKHLVGIDGFRTFDLATILLLHPHTKQLICTIDCHDTPKQLEYPDYYKEQIYNIMAREGINECEAKLVGFAEDWLGSVFKVEIDNVQAKWNDDNIKMNEDDLMELLEM